MKLTLVAALGFLLFASPAFAVTKAEADQAFTDYREGRFEQVIERCDQFLEDPTLEDILKYGFLLLRGSARLRLSRWAEARADFDLALPIAPDEEARAALYWERGLSKRYGTTCTEAIPDFDAAIARKPEGQYYADRGKCYGILGDRTRGIADLEHALTIDPGVEEWRNDLKQLQ